MDLRNAIGGLIEHFSWQEQIMAAVLAGIFLLALVIRIVLTSGYNAELGIIHMQLRGIKSREDIDKLANTPFGRIVKEYASLGARGIGKIDTEAISKLMTYRSRLIFFNYQSLGRLVRALELGILPLGVMFVFAANYQMDFVLIAGVAYGAAKIFASIFDFEMAHERYIATISHALSKDIAKFFPVDATSAILALSADMKEMLDRQSSMYNEILNKISTEFSGHVKTSIGAMTKSVELTLESIAKHEGLEAALSKWSDAIDVAAAKQIVVTQSVDRLEKVLDGFSASADRAAEGIKSSFDTLEGADDKLKEDNAQLTAAITGLMAIATDIQQRNEGAAHGLDTITKYQRSLDASLSSYESSLKDITSTLGDALGKIIDFHLQNAYNTMSEGISENIRQVSSGQNELFHRLEGLFGRLEEQGRYQAGMLVSLKEMINDEQA